jgi:hypothetical protein
VDLIWVFHGDDGIRTIAMLPHCVAEVAAWERISAGLRGLGWVEGSQLGVWGLGLRRQRSVG